MAFDDKYFTSVDTSSYYSSLANQNYNTFSGVQLGESFSPATTPLAGVNLAANHGLKTVMVSAWEPSGGSKGGQGNATAVDRISKLQQDAVGEILRVNNMNFTMHAPIVDIMGLEQTNRGMGISASKKEENMDILKANMLQADRISDKAGLKNTPFCIHSTNGVGTVNTKFDSGFRTKDGKTIFGTNYSIVDRDTGTISPIKSDFQYMNINEQNVRSYKIIPGTETENGMALFEITPDRTIEMQNATALNEYRKKIAENQAQINSLIQGGMNQNDPIIQDLQSSIATANSKISHLLHPSYGGEGATRRQFVGIEDYTKSVIPEQMAKLAMHSLENTKTHPVVSVENEPGWQLGSNPELLIDWISLGRKKFANDLVSKGWDKSAADKKAEELIGMTLDTGHLNTLKHHINPKTDKKYTDKELQDMVKKMAAKGVKLVHIADNIGEFGQDTHLMIGRGDVQNDEFMKILKENGFKGQAQFEAFTGESEFDKLGIQSNLMGVGAPMYSSQPMPRFTDVGADLSNPYTLKNVNYGHNLPPLHWGSYGGPFAGLQSTFGAKMGGESRDQFTGTPTE